MKHLKRYQIQMLVDGELTEKQRERVERHFEKCARCRELKNKIQEQIGELKAAVGNLDPADVQIPELDLSFGKKIKPEKRYVRVPVPAFAAMLVLILFLGAGLFFQMSSMKRAESNKKDIPILEYVHLQSANKERIESMNLDLSGYEFPENPQIKIIRRKKHEQIF